MTRSFFALATSACAFMLLTACAPSAKKTPDPVTEKLLSEHSQLNDKDLPHADSRIAAANVPSARAEAVEEPAPAPISAELVFRTGKGRFAVDKEALQAFHKRGPQPFIAGVRVRPAFKRGKFYGWRIVRYTGPGKLNPGDVVRKINGRPLERPEQFMRVWEALPKSSKLVFELVRGGKHTTLAVPVVERKADS